MTANAILPVRHDGGSDVVRWTMAAALVLAVHVSLIAGYWLLRSVQPQGAADAPAVVIDLAPLTVAPTVQSEDLAPGPKLPPPPPEPAEPPKPKPVEQPKPQIQPKIEPAPVANPLVTLPEPKPQVKSEAKPEPVEKTNKPISAPPPKPLTAPPKAEQVAPTPAVARIGNPNANIVPLSWVQRLLAHLNHYKQYPPAARLRRDEGVVTLSFTMDRDGRVLARHISKSSGSSVLDAEVLEMLHRAEPLPAFPPGMAGTTRSFNVPIRFTLR